MLQTCSKCQDCEILLHLVKNSPDSVNPESEPAIDSQYLDLSPVVDPSLSIFNLLT